MSHPKETRPDRILRRYEAVLELHKQMAARSTASTHPVSAQPAEHAFEQEFAGHRFRVDPGVFAPHPSSAAVVDAAVALTGDITQPVLVDVGTGCGALAIAYALRRPDATVIAIDLSEAAVQCTQRNARACGAANVQVVRGPLLDPLSSAERRADLVWANLPWVAPAIVDVFDLDPEAGWRGPLTSVAGTGRDGLDLVRTLLRQAASLLAPGGFVIAGMDEWQRAIILEEFAGAYVEQHPVIPYFLILQVRTPA